MRAFFTFILVFAYIISYSQGLKIVEVKESVSGSDAFHAPIGRNGHPCGLVKIQTMIPDLRFGGEVEGDFSFENNEYKVYLAKGCKQLVVKRSQVMPVIVSFPEYGIDEISSKATYNIKLKEVSLNATKNLLVIDVRPRKANVYIDDLLIDNENGDGGYRLLLPKGEHLCKIECRGYRSYASVIKIGKETQTINTELESMLADVEIVSQTSGAHIIVDGEEVGVGSWKGKLPAGSYKIDVQLEGFIPTSQSIVLEEKDNRTVSIPQLKRAKGSLSVITDVKDANVYLDGKLISNPDNIQDVQTGEHKLAVKVPYGYKIIERNISVHAGSNAPIQIKMEPLDDIYAKAFKGDVNAQVQICSQKIESAKFTSNDSIERNYWFEKIYTNLDRLNKEQFRKVCPIISDQTGSTDLSLAGMYTYYFYRDSDKAIKILKTWDKLFPGDESVVTGIVQLYCKKNCDEDVIKWAAKAVDLVCYEGEDIYYMQLIAEICLKQGNIDKAFTIFKRNVLDPERLINRYIAIGNAYKKMGNKKTAITYYERFLKEAPNANKYEREDVQKLIQECRR